MQKLGVGFGGKGPVVLTVVGRKSGKPRSTPVTSMIVDDKRYIVAGVPGSDWASNARAAGEATVHQGRRAERVRMVEMSVEEARPLLREFPVRVPTVRTTRRPTASATRSQYLHHEKPQNHRSTPQPVNTTGGTGVMAAERQVVGYSCHGHAALPTLLDDTD